MIHYQPSLGRVISGSDYLDQYVANKQILLLTHMDNALLAHTNTYLYLANIC